MTVTVRWAKVDDLDPVDLPDWLSPAERIRHESLRQSIDRRHFVGVRVLLRSTMAELLGDAADDIELHQRCERCGGAHGRPTITVAGRTGPHVSMAHAGGIVVVAVAPQPVGVDLEPTRDDVDSDHDLVAWVRTEAVLKATGQGLDVDPRLLGISGPDGPPRLESWSGPGRRPAIRLADLDIAPGFVGCLARLGRGRPRIDLAERPIVG